MRLIFEEFFSVGAGLGAEAAQGQVRRRESSLSVKDSARQAIRNILPFHPTGAQKRVLKEIVDDMCSVAPHESSCCKVMWAPGKTIVAIQAAILAIENGYQVALMAPTEILATQHYLYIKAVVPAARLPR